MSQRLLALTLTCALGLNPALAQPVAAQAFATASAVELVASQPAAAADMVIGLDAADRESLPGAVAPGPASIRLGPPASTMDVVLGLSVLLLLAGLGAWAGWAMGKGIRSKDSPESNFAWQGAVVGGLTLPLLTIWLFSGCDDGAEVDYE